MKSPLLTVLMTVYNEEKYLRLAIDSILAQTFNDFEFLIVNDGSTDKSEEIIKSYSDKRIRLVTKQNQGVSAACNDAIKLSRGKYIARQDADDISHPRRLEKLVKILETNPAVGLVGSNFKLIDARGQDLGTTSVFTNYHDIQTGQLFMNQFGQGSVVMRRDLLDKTGFYNPEYVIAHDYDLWIRMSHVTKVINVKEPLYFWRFAGEGLSSNPKNQKRMKKEVEQIQKRELAYFLAHPQAYNLHSFHPFSTLGGPIKYLEKRSIVLRQIADASANTWPKARLLRLKITAKLVAPWAFRSSIS